MDTQAKQNPIHRSLNKPLTILGADRKLFFLAAIVAAATFNFFGSLLGGLLMFVALFLGARVATAKDPQLLRVLLNAPNLKARYDSAKKEAMSMREHAQ